MVLIGFWLTTWQDIRQQRTQQAASERAIEKYRDEQATLQTYLDQIGMLLYSSRSAQLERELRREGDGASEDAEGALISTDA
jgi:hypothetical protein